MLVLGLNAYHGDSSACLLVDGTPMMMVEEERLRRVKHWAGMPAAAVRCVLADAGVKLKDIDVVAANRDSRANIGRKLRFILTRRPSPSLLVNRLVNRSRMAGLPGRLASELADERMLGSYKGVEHHVAHLASSFLVSPFEEAVVLSFDAFGDFASAAWGVSRGINVQVDDRVYFPHSLGIFYQALTQYLGFPRYGDEYKVMGLAPYGEASYLGAMRSIVRSMPTGKYELNLKYFRHHREGLAYRWEDAAPTVDDLFTPALEELLGPRFLPTDVVDQRRRDIARSVQECYEEVFSALLRSLYARYRIPRIALAGGCAMNSVANGKIAERTPFEQVYIQPAAGDAGGALGAALVASLTKSDGDRPRPMDHAYWGPAYSEKEITEAIEARRQELLAAGCRVRQEPDDERLCDVAADHLAAGSVVGWFQGRLEWGPRALGNRSILADPRRTDMRDVLNLKIKRREPFRPFAPSVLEESFTDWFDAPEPDWFMTRVHPIRTEKRGRVPAVTHVDGTGRPQAVRKHTNPLFYRLIERFGERTGVPMVLNTSFNENEPIVCTPSEALDCFLRTEMDVVVLGNHVVERRPAGT